jgi:carboxylesterase
MGGALAVRLAAEKDTIPALGLLAPYLAMPVRISLAARFSALWGVAVPYVRALDPAGPRSIHDPAEAERSLAYGVFTPAALRSLRTTVSRAVDALPRVSAPTLMIQSREDNRIAPADAQRAFDRLGAREKKLIWTTGAGHVITVDYGKERVFELLADWLDQHRGREQQGRLA